MQSNHKAIYLIACGVMSLCVLLFFPETSFSQGGRGNPRVLLVGVIEAPPLYMKTANGRWEGISIELWQTVAQHIGASFEKKVSGSSAGSTRNRR